MKRRTFNSIALKNTESNRAHAEAMNYNFEVSKSGKMLIIHIAPNSYPFAANKAALKAALGF